MTSDGATNLGDIPGLPNLIVSDPNFNVGKHPGEVYVDNNTTLPRKRYDYVNGYYYLKNNAESIPFSPNSVSLPTFLITLSCGDVDDHHRSFFFNFTGVQALKINKFLFYLYKYPQPPTSTYENHYYQSNPPNAYNSLDETDLWTNNNLHAPKSPYSQLYSKYNERNWYEWPWKPTDDQKKYYKSSYQRYSSGARKQSSTKGKNRQYKVNLWPKVEDSRHKLRMHHMHRERRDIYEQIQEFVTA